MVQAAPIIAAAVSAIGTGYSIYAGEESRRAGKQAVRRQGQAQQQAETAAIRQEKLNEMQLAKANQKTPDALTLLGDATLGAGNPTMLTGLQNARDKARQTLLGT